MARFDGLQKLFIQVYDLGGLIFDLGGLTWSLDLKFGHLFAKNYRQLRPVYY